MNCKGKNLLDISLPLFQNDLLTILGDTVGIKPEELHEIHQVLTHKTISGLVSHSPGSDPKEINGVRIFFTDGSAVELKVGGLSSAGAATLAIEIIPDVHALK
jgi:hypothetical protein